MSEPTEAAERAYEAWWGQHPIGTRANSYGSAASYQTAFLAGYLAANSTLSARVAELAGALRDCEVEFRWYAAQHRPKTRPDITKANANEVMAEECARALTAGDPADGR